MKTKKSKENNSKNTLVIKTIIALVFPLILCLVYCLFHHHNITDVYLPAGEWNDELFYYKQVDGIVHYGIPQGYFGFNESRAQYLSFAAWSPVLLIPWTIWGVVFGWNILSPILCNIVILCITSALFVLLVKPKTRDMIALGIMMCAFIPYIRYMLSGMPEIICISLCILFMALAINYLNKEKIWKIYILFAMAGIMTLMRPYLFLFMLLPIFLIIRSKKSKGILPSALFSVVTLFIYAVIKIKLGAEYFAPLYSTAWVTDFFDYGLIKGFSNLAYRIFSMNLNIFDYIKSALYDGLCAGAYFAAYIVMLFLCLVRFILDIIEAKKKKENFNKLIIEGHFLITLLGMYTALVLMYKLTEGSKHLLTFLGLGVFIFAIMHSKYYIENIILVLTFIFFFMIKANSDYDYKVPFKNDEIVAEMNNWEETFKNNMEISPNGPSYDNTIIWPYVDIVDGNATPSKWQCLYYLPSGIGISCCESDYVTDHIDELQSKYVITTEGSQIDELLSENKKELVSSSNNCKIYKLK